MSVSIWGTAFIVVLFWVTCNAGDANFIYGAVSWRPIEGDGSSLYLVEFRVEVALLLSFYDTPPEIGGSVVLADAFDFGDDTTSDVSISVTYINEDEDWFSGIAAIEHEYSGSVDQYGSQWVAQLDSCCRLSTLRKGYSMPYYVRTTLDFSTRTSTDLGNGSPIPSFSPVVQVPGGEVAEVLVPVIDPEDDRDSLSFRLASSDEWGAGMELPSEMTLDTSRGLIDWDVRFEVDGFYPVQVLVSDAYCEGTVDFLMEVKLPDTFCDVSCEGAGTSCKPGLAYNPTCGTCTDDSLSDSCESNSPPELDTTTYRSVASFDASSTSSECPGDWVASENAAGCVRHCDACCSSATFSLPGDTSYHTLHGVVGALQYGNTGAFSPSSSDLDDVYVDGVSITPLDPDTGTRGHAWTYAVASHRDPTAPSSGDCPCDDGDAPPSFAEGANTCESGNYLDHSGLLYNTTLFQHADPVTAYPDCFEYITGRWMISDESFEVDVVQTSDTSLTAVPVGEGWTWTNGTGSLSTCVMGASCNITMTLLGTDSSTTLLTGTLDDSHESISWNSSATWTLRESGANTTAAALGEWRFESEFSSLQWGTIEVRLCADGSRAEEDVILTYLSLETTQYAFAPITVYEGTFVEVSMIASDADAEDSTSVEAGVLPVGATFSEQADGSYLFAWTPDEPGVSTVCFSARDGDKGSASKPLCGHITVLTTFRCDAGSWAYTWSEICTECPAGTYHDLPDDNFAPDDCQDCSAGFYSEGTGNTECIACDVGTWSSTVAATSSSMCTLCLEGTYSDITNRTTACDECPPGSYTNTRGQANCTLCAENYYQDTSGQTSCVACPVGTLTAGEGASSEAHCSGCEAGYWRDLDTLECIPCPEGTYSPTVGAISEDTCIQVPPGYVAPEGSSEPIPLGDSEYANALWGFAAQCNYSPLEETSTGWVDVPDVEQTVYLNFTNAFPLTLSCSVEPDVEGEATSEACGFRLRFNNATGNTTLFFPPNSTPRGNGYTIHFGEYVPDEPVFSVAVEFYEPAFNYANITVLSSVGCECDLGYYWEDSNCVRCEAGYTCPGAGAQTACEAGEYSYGGAYECAPCEDGWICPGEGSAHYPVPDGYYTTDGLTYSVCLTGYSCKGGVLTPCAAGSYGTGGSLPCQACVPGTISNETSSNCTACPPPLTSNFFRDACVPCGPGTETTHAGQWPCVAIQSNTSSISNTTTVAPFTTAPITGSAPVSVAAVPAEDEGDPDPALLSGGEDEPPAAQGVRAVGLGPGAMGSDRLSVVNDGENQDGEGHGYFEVADRVVEGDDTAALVDLSSPVPNWLIGTVCVLGLWVGLALILRVGFQRAGVLRGGKKDARFVV